MSDSLTEKQPETDNLSTEIGFRSFSIANTKLICQSELKMELINSPTIYPIPNSPKYCVGLINLRGSLIPVFNIYPLLSQESDQYKWILVIGELTQAAALVIDDLPEQHFSDNELSITPTSKPLKNLSKHIMGSYLFGSTECLLIDHESLFNFLSINE